MKKVMPSLLMLSFSTVLIGCAGAPAMPSAKEYFEDGSVGWSTSCLGSFSGCYKKAYNQCPKGINIKKKGSGRSPLSGRRGNTLVYTCK